MGVQLDFDFRNLAAIPVAVPDGEATEEAGRFVGNGGVVVLGSAGGLSDEDVFLLLSTKVRKWGGTIIGVALGGGGHCMYKIKCKVESKFDNFIRTPLFGWLK